MKYLVMLCDGMADRPIPSLSGKTPLEAAHTPCMDTLAQKGAAGMARTIPLGMSAGSDIGNMSVMGYNPSVYATGRSPLEAASLGIQLAADDVAIRCNLSSLSDTQNYEDAIMENFSADEIPTEEAGELIRYLAKYLNEPDMELYPGTSFRNCLVLHHAKTGTEFTPPHDISGKPIAAYLPKGLYGQRLLAFQKKSWALLKTHPINQARTLRGEPPANTCWLWGEGTKPSMPSFMARYGIRAGAACAVDIIKGLAVCTGMQAPYIAGATGGKRTDCAAKARAAMQMFDEGFELVYVHVEAPDESAHAGDLQCKLDAIEQIDREILLPVCAKLQNEGAFRVLLMPDHPTPMEIRTHASDPVPFVLFDSTRDALPHASCYSESACAQTGLMVEEAHTLMGRLILGEF